jgi:hypothetical protein
VVKAVGTKMPAVSITMKTLGVNMAWLLKELHG